MQKLSNQNFFTSLAVSSLAFYAACAVQAENESTDDTTAGATPHTIDGSDSGAIANGDFDYYKITNTAGFTNLSVALDAEDPGGGTPGQVFLDILDPDGTTLIQFTVTDSSGNAGINLPAPPPNGFYFVCVRGAFQTIGGSTYGVAWAGSTTPATTPAPDNSAAKAMIKKKCDKIKKALRKSFGSKKRRLAKKLKKCKKKLRALG